MRRPSKKKTFAGLAGVARFRFSALPIRSRRCSLAFLAPAPVRPKQPIAPILAHRGRACLASRWSAQFQPIVCADVFQKPRVCNCSELAERVRYIDGEIIAVLPLLLENIGAPLQPACGSIRLPSMSDPLTNPLCDWLLGSSGAFPLAFARPLACETPRPTPNTIRRPGREYLCGCRGCISRPFAPRPARRAVCSSSVARCYVCHRRRPYKRVWATFDVAHIAGRKICISVSLGRSYLASGGNPACGLLPSARNLLPHPPLPGRTNALTLDAMCARFRNRRFLFGRGAGRAPLSTLPIAARALAFPLAGVRASVGRARPATQPTHARRAGDFPSVGRRGWSRSYREGRAFGACGVLRTFGDVRFAERKQKI